MDARAPGSVTEKNTCGELNIKPESIPIGCVPPAFVVLGGTVPGVWSHGLWSGGGGVRVPARVCSGGIQSQGRYSRGGRGVQPGRIVGRHLAPPPHWAEWHEPVKNYLPATSFAGGNDSVCERKVGIPNKVSYLPPSTNDRNLELLTHRKLQTAQQTSKGRTLRPSSTRWNSE